ncbi:lecithin retinol acyltransferase family protein [Burkholderia ubonensis]|uniref:lecithin retinol acyltransferase family protein n=1 Tax=Burkholderia ubonensis TaxID=101571 RepID=UPI0009B31D89|nr:lecithin retinol acyltransferase family protein [Burkholderia ubonensis]
MNHPTQAQSGDVAFGPDLPVGAHLATRRPGYAHHGIYIGGGKVIHYAGLSRRLSGGPVELVSVDCFAAGFGLVIVRHTGTRYSGPEVAQRAASRLGERNYRLLTNNCEHFCLWCLFGVGRSEQVEACLHNPAHAVLVVVLLAVCVIAGKWHVTTLGTDAGSRDLSVQCAA